MSLPALNGLPNPAVTLPLYIPTIAKAKHQHCNGYHYGNPHAAFAHLYGVSEDDFAYMLSTFPSIPEPVILATRNAYRDLFLEMKYAR